MHPSDKTVIGTRWVIWNKLDENGIITKIKSRLVEKRYSQAEEVDYAYTYALVTRLKAIRLLLVLACCLDFKLYKTDVKSNTISLGIILKMGFYF